MFRYSCKNGYIIFPYDEHKGGEIKNNIYYRKREIDNENKDTSIIELGLKIPQTVETFEDFCEEIKKAEEEAKKVFSEASK
jgi:hypothetical protein